MDLSALSGYPEGAIHLLGLSMPFPWTKHSVCHIFGCVSIARSSVCVHIAIPIKTMWVHVSSYDSISKVPPLSLYSFICARPHQQWLWWLWLDDSRWFTVIHSDSIKIVKQCQGNKRNANSCAKGIKAPPMPAKSSILKRAWEHIGSIRYGAH